MASEYGHFFQTLPAELFLLPVGNQGLVAPALIRRLENGRIVGVAFAPATIPEQFALPQTSPNAWKPTFMRKFSSTDFMIRNGAALPVKATADADGILDSAEPLLREFIGNIANVPVEQLIPVAIESAVDLGNEPRAAVPVYCAPETVPFEVALGHLLGIDVAPISLGLPQSQYKIPAGLKLA